MDEDHSEYQHIIDSVQEIHEKHFVGLDLAEGMYLLAEITASVLSNAPEDAKKRAVIEVYKLVKKAMDIE